MSVRTKTLLILGAALMLATIALLGTVQYLLNDQFRQLENRKVTENVSRVKLAVDNLVDQLASKTTDWAQWDDTFRFMKNRNQEYLHSNISFETLSAINVTHVVYRDLEGKLVNGYEVDYKTEQVSGLSPSALQVLAAGDTTKPGLTPDAHKSGIVMIGEHPYLFAAIPIFDSRRAETCRGSLLFSIALDDTLVEQLASQTRLQVRLIPASKLPTQLLQNLKESTHPLSLVESQDIIRGYSLLRDVNGAGVYATNVQVDRDIFRQGQQAIRALLVSLLIVMAVTLLVVAASLNRLLLARLARLQREVSHIELDKLKGARVWANGKDEIASLARTFNEFLDALERNNDLLVGARNLAESANRAKSTFIARVSHELRNPIFGIRGINEMLLKRNESKSIQDLIRMGDESAEGLLSIVDEILDLSKAESGELTLESIPFDLRQVVRSALAPVSAHQMRLAKEDGSGLVELVCDIAPSVPLSLVGDPTRFRQILINLLNNALKFTKHGYVGLRVSLEDQSVVAAGQTPRLICSVWDTGVGIPSDKLTTIFEPYKQADESITRVYAGTGLGLSIVKEFTNAFGGTISVESTVGVGTTFTVVLPLGVADEARSLLQSSELDPNAEVLYVDRRTRASEPIAANLGQLCRLTTLDPFVSRESREQTLRAVWSAERLIISEDALLDTELYRVVKRKIAEHQGMVVALARARNVEFKEKMFGDGFETIITLPVLSEELTLALVGKSQPIDRRSGWDVLKDDRKLKILVVDDALTNRLVLSDVLGDAGHVVSTASSGQELLDLVMPRIKSADLTETPAFDLIITDISMPIMNGDVATRAIREAEQARGDGRRLPIIAITAFAMKDERQHLKAAGFDGVVTKPVIPESLAAELTRVMATRAR